MTSIQGYNQSYDYTFMYDQQDWQSVKGKQVPNKGSILSWLTKQGEFRIFLYMIHLAQLDDLFNSPCSGVTLFVPTDESIKSKYAESTFVNMSIQTARNMVLYHTLDRQISTTLLKRQKHAHINTKNGSEKILLNVAESTNIISLDNMASVVFGDNIASNGLIHIIDNLLVSPRHHLILLGHPCDQ